MRASKFQEIEHKFIVSETFSLKAFIEAVRSLSPLRESVIEVQDTYFVVGLASGHIFRHRVDAEIQQLTVKSMEEDSESRLEVNLELDQGRGSQLDRVIAFLSPIGVRWQATLRKQVNAFYFRDCEIVFYEASYGDRSIRCVEFEYIGSGSLEHARKLLSDYETSMGFSDQARCRESLFDLLLREDFEACQSQGQQ